MVSRKQAKQQPGGPAYPLHTTPHARPAGSPLPSQPPPKTCGALREPSGAQPPGFCPWDSAYHPAPAAAVKAPGSARRPQCTLSQQPRLTGPHLQGCSCLRGFSSGSISPTQLGVKGDAAAAVRATPSAMSSTLFKHALLARPAELTAATAHKLCKSRFVCPSERNSTLYTRFLPCKALSTWATPHPCRQRCRRPRCRPLVAAGPASAALTMPGAVPGRPPPAQSAGAAPRCGWRRPPRPPHGPCSPAAHAPAAPPQPCLWAEQTRGWRGRLGGVMTWRRRTAGLHNGAQCWAASRQRCSQIRCANSGRRGAHTHPSASQPRRFIVIEAHCPQQPHPSIASPPLPHLAPWAAAPPQCDPPGCRRRGCPAPR